MKYTVEYIILLLILKRKVSTTNVNTLNHNYHDSVTCVYLLILANNFVIYLFIYFFVSIYLIDSNNLIIGLF